MIAMLPSMLEWPYKLRRACCYGVGGTVFRPGRLLLEGRYIRANGIKKRRVV